MPGARRIAFLNLSFLMYRSLFVRYELLSNVFVSARLEVASWDE